MRPASIILSITLALASAPAWSHNGGGGGHGGGGFHSGGGHNGGGFRSGAGFHSGGGFHGGGGFRGGGFHGGGFHGGGFHGGGYGYYPYHGGHFHDHFGAFVGVPYVWPWYAAPDYYPPPAYAYDDPPVYSYDPPVEAPPVSSYPTPSAAAPGTPGNPVVELPGNSASQPPADAIAQNQPRQLYMYPQHQQSAQQQASDRDQCYRWAMDQIGPGATQLTQAQTDAYYRAMEACLDARGYSVR